MDGQQRCFTLLAYLNKTYQNFYGEEVRSEKEGFALTGLTLLSELNGRKFKSFKKNSRLEERWLDKITNGELRIVYIPEKENPYFSVKDYFTRINKTINPLKKTNFRYWNVSSDYKIMKQAIEIANRYQGNILPKNNNSYTPQQFVVNLAYLFYHNQKEVKSFSVQQVTNWLLKLEKEKAELYRYNQEDKISTIRKPYEVAFENVDLFLEKIKDWLHTLNKNICDLCDIKKNQSFSSVLCIYYLLGYVDGSELSNNASRTYDIINQFFKEKMIKNIRSSEEFEFIQKYKLLLSPILNDSNRM